MNEQPAVTEMKLVPIDLYREMAAQGVRESHDTTNTGSEATPSVALPRKTLEPQGRSISAIRDAVMGAEDAQSNHLLQQQPIWTHNDPTTLPEFSQKTSVLKTHQEFVNTVNRTDLPEHLHRALIKITRANYLKAIKYNSHSDDMNYDDDDDDDDDEYRYNAARGIKNVLSRVGKTKKKVSKDVLAALSQHSAHIRWDRFGNIIKPENVQYIRNLYELLNVMVYKDKIITANYIKETAKLLSPFYTTKILDMIKNTKLLEVLDTKPYIQAMSTPTSTSPSHRFRRLSFKY